MRLSEIDTKIIAGETVYACVSRHGTMVGAMRYMSMRVAHDYRPATPRRLIAACAELSGYGGQLVRESIIGAPLRCDAATATSVAAVLSH